MQFLTKISTQCLSLVVTCHKSIPIHNEIEPLNGLQIQSPNFSTHYGKIWPKKITKRMLQNKNPIQQKKKVSSAQPSSARPNRPETKKKKPHKSRAHHVASPYLYIYPNNSTLKFREYSQNTTTIITMVSLRFPFLFSQPPKPKPPHTTASTFLAATAVVATAGAAAIAICQDPKDPFLKKALNSLFSNKSNHCSLPLWGSLSLAENSSSSSTVVESRTGVSFPSVLDDSKRLLGIGLRKKSVLGLKNIDVYAFGTHFSSSRF